MITRHVQILDEIHRDAPEDARNWIREIVANIFAPIGYDPAKVAMVEPQEGDDLLTAVQKLERVKTTKVGDLYERPPLTWQEARQALLRRAVTRELQGFLVVAILRETDRVLEDYASEEGYQRGQDNQREMIEFMETRRDEGPAEDRKMADEDITRFKEFLGDTEARHQRNVETYAEWRRVAGERLDTPTLCGCWKDGFAIIEL